MTFEQMVLTQSRFSFLRLKSACVLGAYLKNVYTFYNFLLIMVKTVV
jgi:hypothetical protein